MVVVQEKAGRKAVSATNEPLKESRVAHRSNYTIKKKSQLEFCTTKIP